jgi:hypothetical protein
MSGEERTGHYGAVDDFNRACSVGTRVLAFPGSRDGRALFTKTRSTAWLVGTEPVVMVEGYAGGIALTHIEVIPTPVPSEADPGTGEPDLAEATGYRDTVTGALVDEPNAYRVSLELTTGHITTTPAHVPATPDAGDMEALVKLLGEHEGCVANAGQDNTGSGSTGVDVWSCGIRVPFVDDLDVMERAHTAAAIAPLLDAARREGAERERTDWSSWLDNWLSAVGPEPPTVDGVARTLRSGPRPFGTSRGSR